VLKTDVEKTENLLVEETPMLTKVVVPLLRGKGSDGKNSKEGGRNKMKRMVGIAVIAVFACALFLVPNACADVNISSNVVPGRGDFESSFTYIATLTNPLEYNWDVTEKVNLTIGPDCNNKSIKKQYDLGDIIIPDGESRTISKDVYFTDLALMQGDFKKWTTEGEPCNWTRAWYQFCSNGMFRVDCDGQDRHPILTLPKPKTRLSCPGSVECCQDFIWTFYVEDKMGGSGNFQILVDNSTVDTRGIIFSPGGGRYTYSGRPFNGSMGNKPFTVIFNYNHPCYPNINESCKGYIIPNPPQTRLTCPRSVAWCQDFIWTFYVEDKIGGSGNFQILVDNSTVDTGSYSFKPGGDEYTYKGRPFNESMVGNYFTVIFNYNDHCYPNINESCEGYITEFPPPEITAYLNGDPLSKDRRNVRYIEKNTSFPFKVEITDYVGSANVTLKLDVFKNSYEYFNKTWNRTLTGTIGEPETTKPYNCNIPFINEKSNFTIVLNYNNTYNNTYKTYNLTIISFEIDFRNATVNPPDGPWNDVFNYSVNVSASRDLDITLKVFDPCTEEWPWKTVSLNETNATKKYYTKDEGKTLYWNTKPNNPPFSENCKGKSKFYFEYLEGRMSPIYRGPELFKPPEFNNGTTSPNVTIYCDWSNSSTPCNYSVNVTTEDEYKVRLLVKDPVSNDWIPKRDIKEISSTTKNITWTNITPFGSLNMDNITQYIGKQANFTFEYDGHIYEEEPQFPGPELVAAFKDPKVELEPGDEVINYNDTFYYSVNVIGSEKLINISLRYLCDEEWISENINNATWNYAATGNWTPHTWECQAINTWEEVRFDVNVTGEGKPIEVY